MKQEMKNTALLVMDVQPGTVNRLENKDEYIEKVSAAVDAAHKKPCSRYLCRRGIPLRFS